MTTKANQARQTEMFNLVEEYQKIGTSLQLF